MSHSKVAEQLNITLANAIVSYQKLHHYHWQVNGSQFFELHAKFEELYDNFKQIVDDVAERILQIGGSPLFSLKDALDLATISEETEIPPAADMVARVLDDFEYQHAQIRSVINLAEEAGDRGTVNLLDGINDDLEKTNWMLRAFGRQSVVHESIAVSS